MVLVFLSEEINGSYKYSQTQKVHLSCLTKLLCGLCYSYSSLWNKFLTVEYFFCRILEMKMLLFNIAYEKSKLQLMNAKRERLLVFSLTH